MGRITDGVTSEDKNEDSNTVYHTRSEASHETDNEIDNETGDRISYMSNDEHDYDHNSSADGEGGNESDVTITRTNSSPLWELGSPTEDGLDDTINDTLDSASPTPVPNLATNGPNTRSPLEAISLLLSQEDVEPEAPVSDRHSTEESLIRHLKNILTQEEATGNSLRGKFEDSYVPLQRVKQALFMDDSCAPEPEEALKAAMYEELDKLWRRREVEGMKLFKHQEKISKVNAYLLEYLSRSHNR